MRRPSWLNLDAIATATIVISLGGLLVIIVVYALLAPVTRRVDQVQLEVTCQVARSNRDQLQALGAIARELGIPVTFTIPPPPRLPPECDDL